MVLIGLPGELQFNRDGLVKELDTQLAGDHPAIDNEGRRRSKVHRIPAAMSALITCNTHVCGKAQVGRMRRNVRRSGRSASR